MVNNAMSHTIAAFYRFTPISNPAELRDRLRDTFADSALCGSLLIAPEGINGTMASPDDSIQRLLQLLASETGLDLTEVKYANSPERPFGRLKFLLKQEIIAFRKATVDPTRPGTYVQPQQWNQLVQDPEVLVLDTRNHYETDLGIFHGAVDPGIEHFSDFVTWVRENLDPAKHRKIAMYCTGGIRCEKASAFLLQEGFSTVYHLKGGILKYLEQIPEQESLWDGTCFVFDARTSVGHADLSPDRSLPASPQPETQPV